MTTDVQNIQQEVQTFVQTLPTTITNAGAATEATGALAAITKKRKEVEKFFKDKFIEPAKKLLEGHKAEAILAVEPLVKAEKSLLAGLEAWDQAEEARTAKEQEKFNKQFEKRVERAVEKGKDVEDVRPAPVVQGPAKTMKTEHGSLTFRVDEKVVVTDEKLIPDQYMKIVKTPILAIIKNALKQGTPVPGAYLKTIKTPVVKPI